MKRVAFAVALVATLTGSRAWAQDCSNRAPSGGKVYDEACAEQNWGELTRKLNDAIDGSGIPTAPGSGGGGRFVTDMANSEVVLVATAQSAFALTTGCTGACQRCEVVNRDSADSVGIRVNGAAEPAYVIAPGETFDTSEWFEEVTSLHAVTQNGASDCDLVAGSTVPDCDEAHVQVTCGED